VKTKSFLAKALKTTKGLFWQGPILNMVEDAAAIHGAKRLALRDPNLESNPVLAIMDVQAIEEFSDAEMKMMTEKIFRTTDPEHPGVAAYSSVGKFCISGPIQVLNFSYFQADFPDTFRTAASIRNEIAERSHFGPRLPPCWDPVESLIM
jgi:sulfate adenylyltransferase